jgi:hypothetical protein
VGSRRSEVGDEDRRYGGTAVDRLDQRRQIRLALRGQTLDLGLAEDDRERRLRSIRRGSPERRPLDPVDRPVALGHGAQLGLLDRTGEDGADRDDRDSRLVDAGEPEALAVHRHPHPQRRDRGRDDLHVVPGEGQRQPPPLAPLVLERLEREVHGDVEGRVEQRRVEAETLRFLALLGIERDLGEDLLPDPPGGGQPLEGGAVFDPRLGEALVDALDLERLCPLGRPGRGPRRRLDRLGVEDALRVADPLAFPVVLALQAGMDRNLAPPVLARSAQADLDLNRAPLGEDQGSLEGKLAKYPGAGLGAGPQRQLDEGGTRQQDGARHGVIRDPGVGLEREASREQPRIAFGEPKRGAQQRVFGGRLSDGAEAGAVGGSRKPVPLALERVGGKRRRRHSGSREERIPVEARTAGPGFGQREREARGTAFVSAQRAEHRRPARVGLVLVYRLAHGQREDRVGADLDQDPVTVVEQPSGDLLEAHRPAQVAVPVLGVQLRGVQRRAGDGGVEGDLAAAGRDRGQLLQDLVAERLDVSGMGRDRGRNLAGAHLFALTLRQELLQRLAVRGEDRLRGAVLRSQLDPARPALDPGSYLPRRQDHRDHRPLAGELGDDPAANRRQPRRVVEAEPAGDVGGGDLPLRVAGHGGGNDSAGAPELGEADRDREEDRLDDLDPCHRGGALDAAEDIAHRPVEVGRKGLFAATQVALEDGRVGEQPQRHPLPLGALAGEEEDRPALGSGDTAEQAGVAASVGQRVEGREQLLAAASHGGRAAVEGGAGGGERVGGVDRIEVGVPAQVGSQAGGRLAQRRLALRRERHRDRAVEDSLGRLGGAVRARLDRVGSRRLFEDHVRVGAADAEGGDSGAARSAVRLPLPRLGQKLDPASLPVDLGGGLVDVQGLRQHPFAHRHRHLDHPGNPSRRLGMTDVRLDRAESQRLLAVLAVGGQERSRLDRVAEDGAPCRAPRPRLCPWARGPRLPRPGGSPAPGRGRWVRSGRWRRRPG